MGGTNENRRYEPYTSELPGIVASILREEIRRESRAARRAVLQNWLHNHNVMHPGNTE